MAWADEYVQHWTGYWYRLADNTGPYSRGAGDIAILLGQELIRWSNDGLNTNAAGVHVQALPPNLFNEPVVSITPRMASGQYDWRYQLSGSKAAGFTVTTTFTKRKTTIDVGLVPLLNIALTEASPGVVTFDMTVVDKT